MCSDVDREDTAMQCPKCNKPAIMRFHGAVVTKWTYHPGTEDYDAFTSEDERVALLRCAKCGSPVVVEQECTFATWELRSVTWPTRVRALSPKVPEALRLECQEAQTCFQHGQFKAAVVMVRRTLEGVCHDHGVARARDNLVSSLRELVAQGKLDKSLAEWADELRVLGNEGAHFTGKAVSREDASDALYFIEALLDYLYALSAQFAEFKKRRAEGLKPKAISSQQRPKALEQPHAALPKSDTGPSEVPWATSEQTPSPDDQWATGSSATGWGGGTQSRALTDEPPF